MRIVSRTRAAAPLSPHRSVPCRLLSGPARTSPTPPLPIHPSPPRSKLALSVKLTLDQVLGFALWHGALAAIYEPHRQACLSLVQPQARVAQQAAPAAGKAAAKKKGK